MPTPVFNPNAAYSTPAFDPNAGYQAASAQSAPADDRNAVQKYVDNLTNVTPEQEQGHSWAANKLQEFGAGAIQGFTAPIVHPLQTLEGVGNTIAHPVDTAVALAKSAYQNPAQAAGNLVGAALLGEAGAAAAGAMSKVASPAVSRALLLGKTPAEAYESAIKPGTAMSPVERANAIQAGLENRIPVDRVALERIADRIADINQKVDDTIATNPNRPISTVPAVRSLDSVRARFGNQVTPQPDLAEIDQVQSNFLNNPKLQPSSGIGPQPGSLSAVDAQAMKKGTYQALGDKAYGELKGANIEAQKSLARELKNGIADAFPELNNLNAQESRLLDLQPVMERAVARLGNQNFFRLGTGLVAGTVRAFGGSNKLAMAAAVTKQVLDDPMVKSRLAIALSKGAKIPYAQAAARIGAYSSALQSTASAPQGYSPDGSPTQ